MSTTYPPKSRLNDPHTWFIEDVIADPALAPQLFDEHKTPTLKVYPKGDGPGNPDIVTGRAEAYILAWETKSDREVA